MKIPHPNDLRRVTPGTVRDVLDAAGVPYRAIRAIRPGQVRVEVFAVPGRRVAEARDRVSQALRPLLLSDGWSVSPGLKHARWRPWATWVHVRDSGFDWIDPVTGRDFFGNLRP